MTIEGSIEITLIRPARSHQRLIEAIRRTRMTLDSLIEVDITEPTRANRSQKILIGSRETEKTGPRLWTQKET